MSNISFKFTSKVFDIQTKKLLSKKKIEDLGIEKSKCIYELLGINDYLANLHEIRIIDEEPKDNLYLLHYVNPGKEVNHIRGTVIYISEEGECKILAQSFPFSEDINVEEMSQHNFKFDESYRVTEVYEGTVVRIYKGPITGEWYFSTHKKINGRKSKWSGPTFGDIFDSMWVPEEHDFNSYFKNDRCYIFILAHPENRLVCQFTPNIRLVGIYTFGEYFNDGYDNKSSKSRLCLEKKHPNIIIHNDTFSNLTNVDELKEIVNSIPWKRSTGVFVYKLDAQQRSFVDYYKLTSAEYLDKRLLRGNEPNLKLRYLEFKTEGNEQQLKDYLELFSEESYLFDNVDKDFEKVVAYLKRMFNRRYKNKEYCIFPQEEHIVVENTKKNYNKELTISQNIKNTLNTLNARQINTLIKHMKDPQQ